jgi:hypothetical protein
MLGAITFGQTRAAHEERGGEGVTTAASSATTETLTRSAG